MKKRNIKEKIIERIKQGKNLLEITKEFSCAKSTVSHHAKKIGHKFPKSRPFAIYSKLDWIRVQELVDRGKTFNQIKNEIGICSATLTNAKKRGLFKTKKLPAQMSLSELEDNFDGKRAICHIRRLFKNKLKELHGCKCSMCQNEDWLGKKLSLELDHIDGNPFNNKASNMRLICPNCHSITDTWRGRNTLLAKMRKENK